MSLNDLIQIKNPIISFSNKYQDPVDFQKVKVVSTDIMQKTIQDVVNYFENTEGFAQGVPRIITQAGGAGSVLSLYSNIDLTSEFHPFMLTVDVNPNNISNLFFKMIAANMNPNNRTGFVADLFGVPENKIPEEFQNESLWEKPNKFLKEYEKFLIEFGGVKNSQYKPKKQIEKVMDHFKSLFSGEVNDKILTTGLGYKSRSSKNGPITAKLSYPDEYKKAVKHFFKSLRTDSKTHFLSNPDLFESVSSMMGENKFQNIKFMTADMTVEKGANEVRKIIEKYGLIDEYNPKGFNIAFTPHVKNLEEFLRENSELVVYSTGKKSDGMRKTGFSNTKTMLLSPKTEINGNNIKEKKLKNIYQLPDLDDRSMAILSHLNIGHNYSPESELYRNIEIINKQNVNEVVIFEPIETPHLRLGTDRRKLLKPRYKTLNEQLKEFHKVLEKIDKPVKVVVGEKLLEMAESMKRVYADAVAERDRETGQQNFGSYKTLFYDRSVFDSAYETIEQVLIPYLLRTGYDPINFSDLHYNKIIDVVDALNSYQVEGSMTPEQEERIDMKFLENTDELQILFDKSSLKKSNAKILANPNYSAQTQYGNPTVSLEDLSRSSQNGTLDDVIKEELLLEGYGAHQGLRIISNKLLLWTPHMMDDTKEFELKNTTTAKPVLADPSHKRNTVGGWHKHNLPGSNIISGSIKKGHIIYKPIFPKIIENMERVQKSGKGYNYYSVFFLNDTQFGSITERPEEALKSIDYWLHSRDLPKDVKHIICGIGDFGQFRNYPMMPVENANLGAVSTFNMQKNFTNAYFPYLTDKKVFAIKMVPGNHEWNTDKLAQGTKYMEHLQGALETYKKLQNPNMIIDFPDFIELANGDVAYTYTGGLDINNLPGLFKHTFSIRGAGKGSASRPSSIMESFKRQMGEITKPYAWFAQGHYHLFDISQRDNTLNIVAGCQAGVSGYEFDRQYNDGLGPTAVMLDFTPDGGMHIETITENYLRDYQIQNPEIAKKGLENHISESFGVDVHSLKLKAMNPSDPEPKYPKTQKMYKREMKITPMQKWT